MLTSFEDVAHDKQWDGRTGSMAHNESHLALNDQKALVFAAKGIIETYDSGNTVGWEDDITSAFDTLKECYVGESGYTLKITKGIHQSSGNPHMTVRVCEGTTHLTNMFHINLTANAIDTSGLPNTFKVEGPFHWGVHSISYGNETALRQWPNVPGDRQDKWSNQRSNRRNSMTEQELVEAIAHAQFTEAKNKFGLAVAAAVGSCPGRVRLLKRHKEALFDMGTVDHGGYTWTWDSGNHTVSFAPT